MLLPFCQDLFAHFFGSTHTYICSANIFINFCLGTKMTTDELHYYVVNAHTSFNESFHSFLLKWLGKDVYYSLTHDARLILFHSYLICFSK